MEEKLKNVMEIAKSNCTRYTIRVPRKGSATLYNASSKQFLDSRIQARSETTAFQLQLIYETKMSHRNS